MNIAKLLWASQQSEYLAGIMLVPEKTTIWATSENQCTKKSSKPITLKLIQFYTTAIKLKSTSRKMTTDSPLRSRTHAPPGKTSLPKWLPPACVKVLHYG